MKDKDFCKFLYQTVVDEAIREYQKLIEQSDLNLSHNAYWKNLCLLYQSLNTENKSILIEIMRQISIDTISHLLGILDGSSYFGKYNKDFNLSYNNQKLNGSLQDLFLEYIQNDRDHHSDSI